VPNPHGASEAVEVVERAASDPTSKRVRDCTDLQTASRRRRESGPAPLFKQEVLLITTRDGECNRHSKQESYFCACAGLQVGGMEASGCVSGRSAPAASAPSMSSMLTSPRPHAFTLTLAAVLPSRATFVTASPTPTFATGFTWSHIYIASLSIIPSAVPITLPPAAPCRTHRRLSESDPRRVLPAPATSRTSTPESCVPSGVPRDESAAGRRVRHGSGRLATARRGLQRRPGSPEGACSGREAAPHQGAARCPRAALPGAAQAQHAGQEGLRLQARRAARQDQCPSSCADRMCTLLTSGRIGSRTVEQRSSRTARRSRTR